MRRILLAAVLAAVVGVGSAAMAVADPMVVAASAGTGAKTTKVRFATVMIKGNEVMRLAETPDYTAEERAEKVQERLRIALQPQKGQSFKPVEASDVDVVMVGDQPVVKLRNGNIIEVTPQDAKLANKSRQDLAQSWATSLRTGLKGLTVAQGKQLPENLVTVAKGTMEMPKQQAGAKSKGGGAGAGTKEQKKTKSRIHTPTPQK